MKEKRENKYLKMIQDGFNLNYREQILLIIQLSIPAIIAQISSVIMQYIDAAMVGKMGSSKAASIGLVATSTWLLGSVAYSVGTGFTVQSAQAFGAKKVEDADHILRASFVAVTLISFLFLSMGIFISGELPIWLGGSRGIVGDASIYFLVYSLGIPFAALNSLAGGMLQSTGNMLIPGVLNSIMCFLDIVLNFLLIFPTGTYHVAGFQFTVFGFGLGVAGAALGTALSQGIIAVIMIVLLFVHSPFEIGEVIRKNKKKTSQKIVKKAVRIALPVAFEHFVVCLAMVVTTRIIAPLGVVAIAANSFAITAESLCYMPGYGIGEAASTLVGQSAGAGRREMEIGLARRTLVFGIMVTLLVATLMYVFAPSMIGILTTDPEVLKLGTFILRIEAFAEPFYVGSIVISGALRGAGDTLVPSIMNFVSLWIVRLPLSFFLAQKWGLVGVWIAMCLELIVRGILFFYRLSREKWALKGEE